MKTIPKFGTLSSIVWVVLTLILTNSSAIHAAANEQLVIDAKAMALANAVSADPPDIMSIHYNPAGLSNQPDGRYFTLGFTTAIMQQTSKFKDDPEHSFMAPALQNDPLDGSIGTSDSASMYLPIYGDPVDFLISPSYGVSYRKPGSKYTFGFGGYMPYWWGLSNGSNDPARFGAKSVYRQHYVYFSPAFSYQMTPTFSFGLSVGFGQTAEGAKMNIRVLNDILSIFSTIGEATIGFPNIPIISDLTFPFPWFGGGLGDEHQGIASLKYDMTDNYSPNFNLGMLWEPKPWFSFGLCYRSEIKTKSSGEYDIEYSEGMQAMSKWFGSSPLLQIIAAVFSVPTTGLDKQSGTVTKDVDLPQMIQGGIKVKPLRWIGLMFDLQWTEWSSIDKDRLVFDQNLLLLSSLRVLGYTGPLNEFVVEQNYKDTLNWSVGVEIDPFHWLTLRCGYEMRESCIDGDYFDLRYAVPDLDNYCAGFGIHFENGMNVDFGFSYLVDKGYEIKDDRSPNFNGAEFIDTFYNPYAGLDYEQDTEAYIMSIKFSGPTSAITQFFGSLF